MFIDTEPTFGELPRAWGYPEGYYRTHLVLANFWSQMGSYAGSAGHLCNFTTQSAGELNLELHMAWVDIEAYEYVEMYTQARFVVATREE